MDEENSVSFYEEINIHTLMMSILFDDKEFSTNVLQFFMAYYGNEIKRYKQGPIAKAKILIKGLENVGSEKINRKYISSEINLSGDGNNLAKLFEVDKSEKSEERLFFKSTRMLQTIR